MLVGRLPSQTSFAGLTGVVSDVFVVREVADLSDSVAIQSRRNFANFAARQLDQGDIAFFTEQLSGIARRTNQLSTAAGIQLQVMERCAGRNQLNRQRIAGKNIRAFAGQDCRADLKSNRLKLIWRFSPSARSGEAPGNAERFGSYSMAATRAGIPVLSRRKSTMRDIGACLKATAAMVCGDFAVRVASAGALARFGERFFRRMLGDLALIEECQQSRREAVLWFQNFLVASSYCLPPLITGDVTDSPRIRSFFRPRPISRRLSSNRDGSR